MSARATYLTSAKHPAQPERTAFWHCLLISLAVVSVCVCVCVFRPLSLFFLSLGHSLIVARVPDMATLREGEGQLVQLRPGEL